MIAYIFINGHKIIIKSFLKPLIKHFCALVNYFSNSFINSSKIIIKYFLKPLLKVQWNSITLNYILMCPDWYFDDDQKKKEKLGF
jgi:hypothetical protein